MKALPSSELAVDVDGAAMKFDKFLNQRETDAAAFDRAPARALHAAETLEQMRQFLGRNAGAGIADVDDFGDWRSRDGRNLPRSHLRR